MRELTSLEGVAAMWLCIVRSHQPINEAVTAGGCDECCKTIVSIVDEKK